METSSKYLDIFSLHFLPIKKFPQVCFVEKKISFPNYVSLFLQIIEINVEQFATKCWNCAKKNTVSRSARSLLDKLLWHILLFSPFTWIFFAWILNFLLLTILVPRLSHLKYQSRGMTTKCMLDHAYSYVQDARYNGGQIKATVDCQNEKEVFGKIDRFSPQSEITKLVTRTWKNECESMELNQYLPRKSKQENRRGTFLRIYS